MHSTRSDPLVPLHDEAHVVVDVAQLLAVIDLLVRVIDGPGRGAELPVLVAVGVSGYAGDDAVAEGEGARGDGVDGEVLAVAGSVAAPGGEEEVGEE